MDVFREYKPETWARAEADRPLIERAIRGAIGPRRGFDVGEFLGIAACCYCATIEKIDILNIENLSDYIYRAIFITVRVEINRARSVISCPDRVARCDRPGRVAFHANIAAGSVDDPGRELACEEVRVLISRLSPRQREVIVKTYGIGGYYPRTADDLARELGVDRATIYTNLWHARRRLRGLTDPRKSRRGVGLKYGPDVRRSVIEMVERGEKTRHVAACHGMSQDCVRYIYNSYIMTLPCPDRPRP